MKAVEILTFYSPSLITVSVFPSDLDTSSARTHNRLNHGHLRELIDQATLFGYFNDRISYV